MTSSVGENYRRLRRDGWIYLRYSLATLGLFGLAGTAILIVDPLLLWIPLSLAQGLALVGFSNAAHECTHGNFARTARGNRIVGALWMLPLLLLFAVHRRYHLAHHRHTAQPDDPEGAFAYTRTPSVAPYLRGALRWAVFPSPLHCLNWYQAVRIIFGRALPWGQGRDDRRFVGWNAVALLAWLVGMGVATLAAHWLIFVYWLPVCVVGPFVAWCTALPKHVGAGRTIDPTDNTRTVRTSRWLQAALWNFNLHTAHHAHPGEPFYNLPLVDAQLGASVRHQATGYLAFHFQLVRSLWTGKPLEGAAR